MLRAQAVVFDLDPMRLNGGRVARAGDAADAGKGYGQSGMSQKGAAREHPGP